MALNGRAGTPRRCPLPTALDYAERLARMTPGDRDVTALVENLRRQNQAPDAR
jgi:hypothetical protein